MNKIPASLFWFGMSDPVAFRITATLSALLALACLWCKQEDVGEKKRQETGQYSYVRVKPSIAMREHPSLSGRILARIVFNEKVKLVKDEAPRTSLISLGERGYWQKVSYKGQEGFVFSALLSDYQYEAYVVKYNQLVPESWKYVPGEDRIPPAPEDCASFEQYAFVTSQPEGDLTAKYIEDKGLFYRERKFKHFDHTIGFGLEYFSDYLYFDEGDLVSLFHVLKKCTREFKNSEPNVVADAKIYNTKVIKKGPAEHCETLRVERTASGIVVERSAYAHVSCPTPVPDTRTE